VERETAGTGKRRWRFPRPDLRTALVAVWVLLLGWFVRYEAFPDVFSGASRGYSSLLGKDLLLEDSWMRIVYKGQPLGYSHTSIERSDENPLHNVTMRATVFLRLGMLGEKQDMRVEVSAHLDVLSHLQDFEFSLWSRGYQMRMRGVRTRGATFKVSTRTNGNVSSQTLEIPDDVVLYSPMTELAVKRLKPGQQLVVKVLDPTTMATMPVTIKAAKAEKLKMADGERDATLLEVTYLNTTSRSWVDAEGRSLREETPFGWVLERCSFEDAMAAMKSAGDVDLLAGLSVPLRGELKRPTQAKALRLRLEGVALNENDFPSARVTVESLLATGAVIRVRAETAPAAADPASGKPPPESLAATASIQSDHPDVRAAAARIVEGAASDADKAARLFDWVHRNVEKTATISVPTTLDVLKSRKGDCNEHTALFVGLARAAGLAAKTQAGIVYQHGAFYYHAWPSVYLGRWVEMDPTWGQRTVDATHLPLASGELADQLQLVKAMGRLRVTLLGEE
jgi:hypothetical protein